MIIHPYRGVQALFMMVPEARLPKRPLWYQRPVCPLVRRWQEWEFVSRCYGYTIQRPDFRSIAGMGV